MEPGRVELGGTWQAAIADDALRRAFASPEFDDRAWEPVDVPGHWRSTPGLAASDGPVLYRRAFASPAGPGQRWWLTLDGVFYDGDVWLDGSYLGATEGYFLPHSFEVTDLVAARSEHVLAVEVGCSRPADLGAKRNLTGIFQSGDALDPSWNPGGIWRPVHLGPTGPVRISRLRVLCPEATAERALVTVRAVLDASAETAAWLRVTVATTAGATVTEAATHHHLAAGDNRIRTQVVVERPDLWWPHALGAQALHDVTVEVLTVAAPAEPAPAGAGADAPQDGPTRSRRRWGRGREDGATAAGTEGHVPSDVRRVRTGLRQVRMQRWIVTVNGERLFAKGASQGPSRLALGEASPDELEGDVALARSAGLDLLRVHAHIARPETYDAADLYGLLLWQDLPLRNGYAHGVRRQAVRQAREAVDLLGHHPSVALWCAHDEPLAAGAAGEAHPARSAVRRALPTWNREVLDASIRRALERADPTRPAIASAGPAPGALTRRDLAKALALVPSLARFVSEPGAEAEAVPRSAEFMAPERWPDLDWAALAARHAVHRSSLARHAPPERYDTFDRWRDATQDHQAATIRREIETLRRIKYHPAGGFCQFGFADGHPGATWSVLDHRRQAKAGYHALVASCAPVIVVADWPAALYRPGEEISLEVHVVNDLRRPLPGLRVVARLGPSRESGPLGGGSRRPGEAPDPGLIGREPRWTAGWVGDAPADSCVRVGTIRAAAPAIEGPLRLDLSLQGPDLQVTNAYASRVARDPGPAA